MASGRAPGDLLDDLSSDLRPSTALASYLTPHRQRIAAVRVMRGTKVQD